MKRTPLIILSIITIFGGIARFWFFWKDGMHIDEYNTLHYWQGSFSSIIYYSMTWDCNPPLFYIIDHISVLIFGANVFAERLPSVIFGTLLIPVTYKFGKELRSETLGLLSALAVATLGSLWYYSQYGRCYMLLCLLFTLFCIFFVRIVRDQSQRTDWYAFVFCSVLLAYSHLFAIVPISVMFLYLMISKWREGAVHVAVITFWLTFPLILIFNGIRQARTIRRDFAFSQWSSFGIATVPRMVALAPLELFGYPCIFWLPLIIYSTWTYRKMEEIVVIVLAWVTSFGILLLVANFTGVFTRYILLVVPAAITIGLLPVADFIDDPAITRKRKYLTLGLFAVVYFALIAYAFVSGLYISKENILFNTLNIARF